MGLKLFSAAAAAIVLACIVAPLLAHHSNAAQYDATKRTTIEGQVSRVMWTNPHAYFYLDVRDSEGRVNTWALEGFPPYTLLRTGWQTSMLQHGDAVSVEGALARDGSNLMLAREVTLPDGRKLYWGPQQ